MSNNKLRIVLAQLDFTVGDITQNLDKHIHAIQQAQNELAADMIVFPELSLTSYPPEDLLLRNEFITGVKHALQKLIGEVSNIYCVVGYPHVKRGKLFNACAIIHERKVLATYAKQCLPNYEVFDERRYFQPGNDTCILNIKNIPCGFLVCEDLWKLEPVKKTAAQGAKLLISLNASPFEIDKHEQRLAVIGKRARQNQIPIIYVNHVGGQDDLVFDGGSMLIDTQGELCQHAGFFNENLFTVEVDAQVPVRFSCAQISLPKKIERIYQALMTGLRDYVDKNHFQKVVIGLSGGIDSALVLTIAADALGKERVHAIIMPSRFTAEMSVIDAKTLAENLGVTFSVISIEPAYKAFLDMLSTDLSRQNSGFAEQNIQARIRAVILMAYSNMFGHLVITTGNRSELATGYCTLYGDMAGGYDVLKDVPKTLVYELARYRNEKAFVIPKRIIERPPSAELAEDQKDEDNLPPYNVLDPVLDLLINQNKSREQVIAQGFAAETVDKIYTLLVRNEYKRKQAPPGPRINHKSFGKDWRYPITNGFKG